MVGYSTTASPNSLVMFCNLVGMLQYKKIRCKMYPFVQHRLKSFKDHSRRTYHIKQLFGCFQDFVVYCLSCPCGLLYLGHAICTVRAHFWDHRRFNEDGSEDHSDPRHFLTHHKKSTEGLNVWVIESIPPVTLKLRDSKNYAVERPTEFSP